MKTKSNSYHIDLRDVSMIGPLTNDRHNNGTGLGCAIRLRGAPETIWLAMSDDKIDPYQIDDAKNAFARATAQANYNQLVEQWNAAD